MKINQIPINHSRGNQVVYVVHVPQSMRAPYMEPARGFLRLRIENSCVVLKPEEIPRFLMVAQEGRERDFLRIPDLSLDPNL